MSKATILNGLTKNDIVLLYTYLAFYEDNHIKTIKSDTDLNSLLPDIIIDMKALTKNIKFKRAAKGSVSNAKDLKNEIIYVKHHTIILSILYHLRNAIAHHLLEVENKKFTFWDISSEKNQTLTAYGTISIEKVKNIIKLFV